MFQTTNRLQSAPLAVCNDRRPTRLCLQRGNAEIFFSGKYEGACALHVLLQGRELPVPKQFHVFGRPRFNFSKVGTIADDNQLLLWQFGEGIDNEVHALIGDHPGGSQIILLLLFAKVKLMDVYRWIDNLCLSSVRFPYSTGYEFRDG